MPEPSLPPTTNADSVRLAFDGSNCLRKESEVDRHFAWCLVGVAVALLVGGGCSAVGENGKSMFPTFATQDSRAAEEEAHRSSFQEFRRPADFRWLLSHRIQSGMSPAEVGKVFGENGLRSEKDGWIKKHDTNYRVGDVSYKCRRRRSSGCERSARDSSR